MTVVVPEVVKCTVKDRILYGSNCVDTNTGKTSELDYDQTREMIEYSPGAQGHPPAVFMSLSDAEKEAEVIDTMCRALGKHCTKEAKQFSAALHLLIDRAKGLR